MIEQCGFDLLWTLTTKHGPIINTPLPNYVTEVLRLMGLNSRSRETVTSADTDSAHEIGGKTQGGTVIGICGVKVFFLPSRHGATCKRLHSAHWMLWNVMFRFYRYYITNNSNSRLFSFLLTIFTLTDPCLRPQIWFCHRPTVIAFDS
jgi:hypothetical protein